MMEEIEFKLETEIQNHGMKMTKGKNTLYTISIGKGMERHE